MHSVVRFHTSKHLLIPDSRYNVFHDKNIYVDSDTNQVKSTNEQEINIDHYPCIYHTRNDSSVT